MNEGTVGIIIGTQFLAGSIFAPERKNPLAALRVSSRAASLQGLSAKRVRTDFILPKAEGETPRCLTTTSRIPEGDNFRHSCSCGSLRKILLSAPVDPD